MLCSRCEAILKRTIESHTEDKGRIHDTLESLQEAVALGCLICTQWSDSLMEDFDSESSSSSSENTIDNKNGVQDPQTPYDLIPTILDKPHVRNSGLSKLQSNNSENQPQLGLMPYSTGFTGENDEDVYLTLYPPQGPTIGFLISRELSCYSSDGLDHPEPEVVGTSTASMPYLWRLWLQICQEHHPSCMSHSAGRSRISARLIQIRPDGLTKSSFTWRLTDLKNDSLVRYTTLSHCWGTTKHMKLQKANIQLFYSTSQRSQALPKTYKDAFEVTWNLGFQYIWIDSLCIVQDDLVDWQEQSSMMGLIYGNSSCNIAAAFAKDGDHGCYNMRNPVIVSPTRLRCKLSKVQEARYIVAAEDFYFGEIVDSPLSGRAWVTQERCLALRQLSFGQRQVFWECLELTACEQMPSGIPKCFWKGDLVDSPVGKPTLTFTNECDLQTMWRSLIEHYSYCKLTKQSDKTIAIAGLAARYALMTNDDYLAGLWRKDFHHQLCWSWNHIWDTSGNVDIRLRTKEYQGPSWSWLSIDGPVSTTFWSSDWGCTRFSRLVEAQITSKDPQNLHSFTSCEIKLQAIAVNVFPILLEDEDIILTTIIDVAFRTRAMSEEITLRNITLFLDEGVPDEVRSWYPNEWAAFQESSKKDMLLVLTGGNFAEGKHHGIVLRKASVLDKESPYVRIGMVHYQSAIFKELLVHRLALRPEQQSVDAIDLDDPRISDLVQTIKII